MPLTCDPAGTTTATVTVTGGTAPFTYLWTPAGGNQSTATGLPSGNYTVLVTDSNLCVDSAFVNIPAVVPVQISINTASVQCNVPNSGSATAIVTSGNAPFTYLWSDGSTAATAANLAGGTYTVTVTDANGCSASTIAIVGIIPDVFANAGTAQTVCSGQPATLTAVASGGTAPFGYSWSNGSVLNPETVNPTVTTTYTVTVIDANGCQATSSVTVNVQDYPVVTVSPAAFICFGSATPLSATGGNSYSWSPVDGLNDATIANPIASPTVSTTYTVSVSNGLCTSTATVDVTVAPEVIAGFSPDTTNGQAPLTVNFNNSSTGAATYEWSFGDGGTSGLESPSHTYTNQGSYPVLMVATNSLGCTDTVRYSFIVVEELASLIVPNIFTPNGDGLNDTFSFIEKGISSINVKILNRWGTEVYSWSKTNSGWDGVSKDGEELPDGVYLYIINAQGINDKPYNFQGTVQLIRNKK
ncbi:MAG: gliding motility-associated C-terminal domain-containing protein [Bacteroidetes bacterium]|nr:gliding motility-associated C-terminal domain-containing protein [Bacteroidota bacterium]